MKKRSILKIDSDRRQNMVLKREAFCFASLFVCFCDYYINFSFEQRNNCVFFAFFCFCLGFY